MKINLGMMIQKNTKVKILDKIKVYDIFGWFEGRKNLTEVDGFEKIDVSDCEYMFFLFNDCSKLQIISDLTNWDVSNCKDFTDMFGWNESLQDIYLPSTLKELNISMFDGCKEILKIHLYQHIYTYNDLWIYEKFTK